MTKLRNGHAPTHVRQTFTDALDAFRHWDEKQPEPKVMFEANYVAREISISQACGLVWNCTDVIPRSAYWELREFVDVEKHTYAACARAMLAAVKAVA